MWLFNSPSTWVDINSEEAAGVVEENKRYKQVCQEAFD